MRTYRKRPSRASNQFKKVIGIFVVSIFCVGYLFLAGKLGVAMGDFITPVISNENQDTQVVDVQPTQQQPNVKVEPKQEPSPQTTVKQEVLVSENIKVEPNVLYCIQIGAFSEKTNAEETATTLRERGAGGYILNKDYYRVLVAGYANVEDAEVVKDQLESSGIESTIYSIEHSGLNFDITADKAMVETITNSYAIYEQTMKQLYQISMDLDSKTIELSEAGQQLRQEHEALKTVYDEIIGLENDISGDNAVVTKLMGLYKEAMQELEKIIYSDSLTTVRLSSLLKHQYISMFVNYSKYIKEL